MEQTHNSAVHGVLPHLIDHPAAILCLLVFIFSYIVVLFEEKVHMPKSKPVMFGAAVIWVIIALMAKDTGLSRDDLHLAVNHGLEEYASLLMFLLAAMTYISTLQNRRVFDALRARLIGMGLNLRQIFWVTGILAFFISPFADNLTTALVMGSVVLAVGGQNKKFVALSCINVVCAANAGGAFSPFGDITTLMVWQAGKIEFFTFFSLFLPSLACFLVPAYFMSLSIPTYEKPAPMEETVTMAPGAKRIITLGFITIALAVGFEQFLGLPPFMGMMAGLSLLSMFAWYLRKTEGDDTLDILELVASSEWDTLLFFFGVIFSVGGLAYIGYLEMSSTFMYEGWGPSTTNILMGFVSAVIDNIPVMFAILSMNPDMDEFQWLLVTLTAGVGGSMLSVGSAAGVALMGLAKGQYTFMEHLKWTPVIILGYFTAVGTHFLLNPEYWDYFAQASGHK